MFGLNERHIRSIVAIPISPSFATVFHARSAAGKRLVLVGDAAMSHHFWPGRGLNAGLQATAALARALFVNDLNRYEIFMQQLRRAEMQDRSLCMMRKPTAIASETAALPTWPARLRTEVEIADASRVALANDEQNRAELVRRVLAWRDVAQMQGEAWPHPPVGDAEVDGPLRRFASKPSALTVQLLLESAARSGNGARERYGWPVDEMRGPDAVQLGELLDPLALAPPSLPPQPHMWPVEEMRGPEALQLGELLDPLALALPALPPQLHKYDGGWAMVSCTCSSGQGAIRSRL